MSIVKPTTGRPARPAFWRAAGPWLVLGSAAYLFVNVVRVLVDPGGFARYFGLPLAAAGDDGWVLVYASRTALLAAVALILLYRKDLRALSLYAALTVLGPLSDALQAARHDAGTGTVVRHLAIGALLLVVAVLLGAQHRRTINAGSE